MKWTRNNTWVENEVQVVLKSVIFILILDDTHTSDNKTNSDESLQLLFRSTAEHYKNETVIRKIKP
jgi:hypothetical protein